MKKLTDEELRRLEEAKAEDSKLQEVREQSYKEFFGRSWREFELHWMTEDLTPEEAVDRLGDEMLIDYCDYCKTYYFVNSSWGVYHCPYCYHIGSYSEPDYESRIDC